MIRTHSLLSPLVFRDSISGLLRRGTPVIKTWNAACLPDDDPKETFTAKGVVLADDAAGERWSCWFDDDRIGLDTGFAPTPDLEDPTGRFHLALWLAEHGHPLWPWLVSGLPDRVTAAWLWYSALRVSRGGTPLLGLLGPWRSHRGHQQGESTRTLLFDPTNRSGGLWVGEHLQNGYGWQNGCVVSDRGMWRSAT